jgi:hypothetical protein
VAFDVQVGRPSSTLNCFGATNAAEDLLELAPSRLLATGGLLTRQTTDSALVVYLVVAKALIMAIDSSEILLSNGADRSG